jgi:hypothetical protein
MLEDYFAQEKERLEEDLRPELGYQVVSAPRAKIGVDRSSTLSVGPLIIFTFHIITTTTDPLPPACSQGATLEDTEKPSCKSVTKCTDIIAALPASERPLDITGADPKCRFFWKMSDQRTTEAEAARGDKKSKLHDAPNVVPRAFEGVWEGRMEDWGVKMKTA